MAAIQDHEYVKRCAELASLMGISLASARKQVELAAAREGGKDLAQRKAIAERLVHAAQALPQDGEGSPGEQLTQLLGALAHEENFMVED
ncbi:MAG: hypothetical protein AB8B70_07730 [Prochlorococcus sp.]